MRKIVLIAVTLLLVAACAQTPQPAPPPPPETPTAPADVILPPQKPRDFCGAEEFQNLIGRPKSEIPVPLDPSRRRVTCTTCPVTMDFRQDRLNILFDADSGIIKEVKCG